nr:hypothetical protein Iba_chr06bCG10600 [Ipomoea batatas]
MRGVVNDRGEGDGGGCEVEIYNEVKLFESNWGTDLLSEGMHLMELPPAVPVPDFKQVTYWKKLAHEFMALLDAAPRLEAGACVHRAKKPERKANGRGVVHVLVSVAGSALGSPSPSAGGLALSVAPNSAGGPVVVAASADGPAETSTIGTGRLLPSGTEGGLDIVLHCPPPAVEGPSAELVHQVFSDRSPGDGSQNGFSGLSASADMTGEQDGVGEDLLSQVRTLQDSAPGLLGCLELAFELLDPLVPLSKGLLEGRHLSTVYFVPVFGPGEEIGDRVGHLQGYGLAVEVDNTNAE